MAYQRKSKRLGDMLLEEGKITEEQLAEALKTQREKSLKLGEALIFLNYVSQGEINDFLCEQLDIEYVSLRKITIDETVFKMVPEQMVRKYSVVPFSVDTKIMNVLNVAMDNPMDINAIDDIGIVTGLTIQPYLASAADISFIIDKFYSATQFDAIEAQFSAENMFVDEQEEIEENARKEDIENSPAVQMVREIIEQAVRQRASDIHIEPFEDVVHVRYRVDGVLRPIRDYRKNMYNAIVARLKIMSGMDIAEKRKPQDGRISILVDRHEYDIRVSNLPTVFGEKVVMRLASKAGFNKDKKDLGMQPDDLIKFENILKNPNGIILVTGPTGSGKSTTLYTALSSLASDEVNIVTVEDPVEANVNGVNQVQVNVKADMTFASALRSILRQDPDIIMIGEIRDGETASIAVKASITGHLVVSTLHTNSTSASISRLIDMGVEPYLLGDSLVGIIAQRLVRRLCECKIPVEATESEKRALGVDPSQPLTIHAHREGGCQQCGGTGYFGRIGVYEIMPISRSLRRMIAARATAEEITQQAQREGMHTLRQSAAMYVLDGTTTFDEMMKITYETES